MRTYMAILFIAGSFFNANAQRTFKHYETEQVMLKAGDTIQFNEGSMNGQFVHVYTLWGYVPPVKTPFNGTNSWMVIHQFRRKKVKGEEIVYAIGFLPNMKNVRIYVAIEGAMESKEIRLK